MKRTVAIGRQNFADIRERNCFYIDKTNFIKEWWENEDETTLITRPRRFGKTLNMSMIRYFLEQSNENTRELFENTKIMEAGDKYLQHMGKYPVISISLKSLKQEDFELSFDQLKRVVKKEYDYHWSAIDERNVLTENEKERYKKIRDLNGERADYYIALEFLSECLCRCHKQKVIILIDEYDVPLENAYFLGFYDKMISLIRSLFESALKTNSNLEFAVLTGCLRISKESIFTGLNNLETISILNNSYAEYFGFTQEEVDKILENFILCFLHYSVQNKSIFLQTRN